MTSGAAVAAPIKSPLVTKELFEQAYAERYEQTVRLLVKSGYRRQVAEDLGQDAWSRAWRFRAQFDGRNGSSFATWVGRIALNVGKCWLRKWDQRMLDRAEVLAEGILTTPGFKSEIEAKVDVERLLNGDGLRQQDKDALIHTYINNSIDVCMDVNNRSNTARRLAVMRARRSARVWLETGGSNVR